MSAFMVEDQTINSIVNYLHYCYEWPNNPDSLVRVDHFNRKLSKIGLDILNPEKLGNAMLKLNAFSINERYGPNQAETFRPLDYSYISKSINRKPMQVFKSLQCLIYQCSEGRAMETELYKLLIEIKNILAVALVSDLPEYEKADWR